MMMELGSTSETSVNFHQTTWRKIAEDGHCALSLENRKSHPVMVYSVFSVRPRLTAPATVDYQPSACAGEVAAASRLISVVRFFLLLF